MLRIGSGDRLQEDAGFLDVAHLGFARYFQAVQTCQITLFNYLNEVAILGHVCRKLVDEGAYLWIHDGLSGYRIGHFVQASGPREVGFTIAAQE